VRYLIESEISAQNKHLETMRFGGMVLATFGFAAFASGLGAGLLNVPILGRLLGFGLWLGGATVGFLSGLTAIIIGWLSARPIVAFLLVGGLVALAAWRILVSNKAMEKARIAENAAQMVAIAKQRHRERQNAGTPPPPPPPPPPGTITTPAQNNLPPIAPPPLTSRAVDFSVPQAPIPAALSNGDLPPLEWTPSSSPKAPPSVRKPTPPVNVDAASAEPTPSAKAKAKRIEIAEKNGYTVSKIVYIDGPKEGEIVCFELLRGKEVLTRGTQEEVKLALRLKLEAS
jgi:Transmembrane protein 43